MSEATIETIEGTQFIKCGEVTYCERENGSSLIWFSDWEHLQISSKLTDDLYAVLHARHVAQHYNAEIIKRIGDAVERARDRYLKGGEA